ncbi:mevalonate kinase family protein [Parvicella tangerina]|uniref:mevalonate kinase family protein n=1 Tax=Parvicella tangerina TaxID=2829795 RepID=UPI00215D0701|nr:mevalonate kinase [Parvicella tangerina]
MKESLFYGKILLFGEYGVIEDSMALSIPFENFNGQFIYYSDDETFAKESNQHLLNYYEHLVELTSKGELPCEIDLDSFKADIDRGMLFDSSIPQGYGVGSSGALVAAIYDKYALNKIDSKHIENGNILKLKSIFGKLESYFHGTSSGLDPLICYLRLPILIKSKSELESVGIPAQGEEKGGIFLLNTGQVGKTQPLVEHFMERCKEDGFRNMIKTQFKKYNDASISAFLTKDGKSLLSNVKHLSKIVLEHFKPMIPNLYQELWQEGINSNAYYLKLCGSGGGGFILGFTEDLEKAKTKLKDYQMDVIYRF